MSELIDKTKQYISAFHNKDIAVVSSLMNDNFSLSDPGVKALTPKIKVIEFISTIFENSGNEFRFEANDVWESGDYTFIEFQLDIGGDRLEGVDIIRWQDGKMIEMHAYLNSRI